MAINQAKKKKSLFFSELILKPISRKFRTLGNNCKNLFSAARQSDSLVVGGWTDVWLLQDQAAIACAGRCGSFSKPCPSLLGYFLAWWAPAALPAWSEWTQMGTVTLRSLSKAWRLWDYSLQLSEQPLVLLPCHEAFEIKLPPMIIPPCFFLPEKELQVLVRNAYNPVHQWLPLTHY